MPDLVFVEHERGLSPTTAIGFDAVVHSGERTHERRADGA